MKERSKQHKNSILGPKQQTFTIFQSSQCLKVDKNKINFCKYPIFASSSKQIIVNLQLMDYFNEIQRKDFHLLKLKTNTNPILNCDKLFNLEKIFTIKAVENGEEVNQLEIPIRCGEPMQIYVKTNIPELDISMDINGVFSLQIDDYEPIVMPVISRGEVPQIICLKQMESIKTAAKIIKIPSKGIMKIPFKNCSNINFFFQIKLIGRDLDKPDCDGVRINVLANIPPIPMKFEQEKGKSKEIILKVDANSAFCVTLELETLKKDSSIRIARRILILQVQGTKLLFPFPLEVIICD